MEGLTHKQTIQFHRGNSPHLISFDGEKSRQRARQNVSCFRKRKEGAKIVRNLDGIIKKEPIYLSAQRKIKYRRLSIKSRTLWPTEDEKGGKGYDPGFLIFKSITRKFL